MSNKYTYEWVAMCKVKRSTHDRVKKYCKENNMILQSLIDNVIVEWLDMMEDIDDDGQH